ncbi:MAG: hypothetical protein DYH08_04080 [Actinobacteria bacterium ATB1]|nr:hypothetical protein [Actinobacteria bacterium ATB1]
MQHPRKPSGDWPEGLVPADVFVGDTGPYHLTPNAGNGYTYVFCADLRKPGAVLFVPGEPLRGATTVLTSGV